MAGFEQGVASLRLLTDSLARTLYAFDLSDEGAQPNCADYSAKQPLPSVTVRRRIVATWSLTAMSLSKIE